MEYFFRFDFVSEFEPMLRGSSKQRDRHREGFLTGANFEPTGIRKVLGLLEGSTFKVEGRQEDAEEFLSHLLNSLHDEMLKVCGYWTLIWHFIKLRLLFSMFFFASRL